MGYAKADGADEEAREVDLTDEAAKGGVADGLAIITIQTENTTPKVFYIKKTNAERPGYTRGCGGCSSWHRGLGRQQHTKAYRSCLRKLLEDGARTQNLENTQG